MDENHIEFAELLEQAARDMGRAKASASVAPETHPGFDGEHCIKCGDAMPAARLTMQRIRCVTCQTQKEKYDRR